MRDSEKTQDKTDCSFDLATIVSENKESIKKAAVDALKEKVADKINWTMSDEVGAIVTKFFQDEIAPEVVKMLVNNKQVILDELSLTMAALGEEVRKALLEKAIKNLSSSDYNTGDIVKKIFGIY